MVLESPKSRYRDGVSCIAYRTARRDLAVFRAKLSVNHGARGSRRGGNGIPRAELRGCAFVSGGCMVRMYRGPGRPVFVLDRLSRWFVVVPAPIRS